MSARRTIRLFNDEGNAAFASGSLAEAAAHYERAVAVLSPAEDDLAGPLYENVGLARFNLGHYRTCIRAFLRALDGRLESRQQSLRFLITACVCDGRTLSAQAALAIYEPHFGAHPDGWTKDNLQGIVAHNRSLFARRIVC